MELVMSMRSIMKCGIIKEYKYPIIGAILSVALVLIGIFCDSSWCLTAGIVFLLCNIGAVIGYHFRSK